MIKITERLLLAGFFLVNLLVGNAGAESFCGSTSEIRLSGNDPREGIYVGEWRHSASGSRLCGTLVIEKFNPDGTATAVYFWGVQPTWNIRSPGNRRMDYKVNGDTITFEGTTKIQFKIKEAGLDGMYGTTPGTFQKQK